MHILGFVCLFAVTYSIAYFNGRKNGRTDHQDYFNAFLGTSEGTEYMKMRIYCNTDTSGKRWDPTHDMSRRRSDVDRLAPVSANADTNWN